MQQSPSPSLLHMDFSKSSHLFGVIAVLIIIAAVTGYFFMKTSASTGQTAPSPASTAPEAPTESIPTKKTPAEAKGAIIKTNLGDIEVELFASDAPKTVENFSKLADAGFYAGTKFHRVIKGFMIQGGDPLTKDDTQKTRWGTGGPGYMFDDEINSHKIVRGALAMANSGPNTNGSQFFIVTSPATPWLDGKHTMFGKVIKGMGVVDTIENTPTATGDVPKTAVVVESVTLK